MLQMPTDKQKRRPAKHSLPTLRCECRHEILLLPEPQALGKAIEEHAMEHQKKYALTQEEADALQDNLIAQAFRLAAEMESSPATPLSKRPRKKETRGQNP
jgi:hypothetical protein